MTTDAAARSIRLAGGRVLPCRDTTVIEDGTVVIRADRIEWVGESEALPEKYRTPDYEEVNVAGATVMPGLVDGHMHISFGEAASEEELSIYTPAEYRSIRAAVDAEKALLAGVTSSCDPGGPYRVALAVRDAIAAGLIQGPRMAAAGRQITTQQGIADGFPSWIGVPDSSFGALVRSEEELIQEIRNEVKDGVDLIKIAGSGPHSDEFAAFDLPELEVATREAHRLRRPITIHARSRQSVEFAARVGVDWIMHASYMDEPTLEVVLEKSIPLLPAMTLLVNTLEAAGDRMSPQGRDAFKRELDAATTILSKAYEAGATLIAGSETGFAMTPYGEWHARELELFVDRLGIPDSEALLCMTRNAAQTVPPHTDDIGTLEAGKYADVLVVDGRPDEDVTVLQDRSRLRAIYKGGAEVRPWRPPDAPRRRHSFERTHLYTTELYHQADRKGQARG